MSIPIFAQHIHYPGGVPGAEVWYITEHDHLSDSYFPNVYLSSRVKELTKCDLNADKSYFNFNESFESEQLCLFYTAPLENTTARNVFFVGEPTDPEVYSSHLTTNWNIRLGSLIPSDSIIRNRFDLSNRLSYANRRTFSYQSDQNANVNFYNWNQFQVDKKLKSYGYDGESLFYIGRAFPNAVKPAEFFSGNFPEFISFPFELSDNQKNRVESYLAVKYGLTLSKDVSYRNSKNIVFWRQSNNAIFPKRIFGIGRDDISGLNQLESESTHFKNFLVASVGELMESNKLKQEQVHIDNGSFIVSGDNDGKIAVGEKNQFGVRRFNRVWLAQKTGEEVIPVYFTLTVPIEIRHLLTDDPSLRLWMLHDKYVNNQEVSDFDSQYVEHYLPEEPFDLQTATYRNVFFDSDKNIFDQYTFGVGPEMIVQVRSDGKCEEKEIAATVVITGGKPPYTVRISDDVDYYEVFNVQEQTQNFTAYPQRTYTVKVEDAAGVLADTTVETEFYEMHLDLGPDITLSATQTTATLDAGQGITDPNATYQWYLNGTPIEAYESTLIANEPGEYSVTVTSGNRKCTLSDTIEVSFKFEINVETVYECYKKEGSSFTISLSGGIAPFTTVIAGNGINTVQVHNSEIIYTTGLNEGTYTITSTDINGNTDQKIIVIGNPLDGIYVDLYSQAAQVCSVTNYLMTCPSITLDASLQVTNPNVSYQWLINGNPVNINVPVVQFYYDEDYCGDAIPGYATGFNEYRVRVTNLITGCSLDSWVIAGTCYGLQPQSPPTAIHKPGGVKSDVKPTTNAEISTTVYPNPSKSGSLFNYEISSSAGIINGVVEIHSPTGALISSTSISGQSSYKLPFSLLTSGVYFITVKTNSTIITDQVIIK